MITQSQGNLHLFLGYANGVGKTHTMLELAVQRQKQGCDIVVSYIKKFSRAGYLELLNSLTPVDNDLNHIDVEAIIRRRPDIVVIDDFHERTLAGSIYKRRYEEVEAILNAGIDVYATLTVFYLDSLADIVEKLLGIRFDNTVPDRLLNNAQDVELIDVAVSTVLSRINQNLVAFSDMGIKHLFLDEQTLVSLRQLALRYVTQWVESSKQVDSTKEKLPKSLSTNERLMVCISPSPLSAKLIRAAYHLARELNAEWTTVYVEGSHSVHVNEESQNRLIQNMHLVEKLGGRVVTIHGESIADTLIRYAKQHEITKIVVGYPTQPYWYKLWNKSLIDRLIQKNDGIDIYVINSGRPTEPFSDFVNRRSPTQWRKYFLTFALITATTLIDIFINPFVFPATLVTLYLLGIAAAAVYLGYRPALIATILSVVSFFFFFVPHTIATPIGSLPHIVILVGLLIAGVIVTRFITNALERAKNADRRADQMMDLYSFSRDLSTTVDFDVIIKKIVIHVKHTFQAEVGLYLSQDDQLELYQATSAFDLNEDEQDVAIKAFETGQATGFSTASFDDSTAIYVPMRTAHKKIGVMGVSFTERRALTLDQHRLLDAFANQASLAIESSRLVEQDHQVRIASEREKLQAALLDSISHDIRTPLVSITGALSSLRDESSLYNAQVRSELIDDAWAETERLNRLVENLLEMSRLQSGELNLNSDWHDLDEIIAVARSQLRSHLLDYKIVTHIQQEVSLVYVDFTLMVQVLVNLLDNAAKYTTETKIIEICTMTEATHVVIQIADHGVGIPDVELPHIFNKFYRATNVTNVTGTGLGLSICAGIVEAHNGRIHAYNRPDGGAVFEVRLPMKGSIQ